MTRRNLFALTMVLTASVATAHSGVKNIAVKARMESMSAIVAEMKILGTMASGAIAFDLDKAKTAAASIAKHAASTPDLFRAQENDPKSEAKDVIWTQFDDFSAKARAMETIAQNASQRMRSTSDVSDALVDLGATCKSCHAIYRE